MNFLRQTFAAKGLILLFLCSLISIYGSTQVQIGLQLYSFRNQIPKNVPGMLAKISKMGFRYLEGGGTYNLSRE